MLFSTNKQSSKFQRFSTVKVHFSFNLHVSSRSEGRIIFQVIIQGPRLMHALPSFSYSILNQWPACQVTKGEKKRDGGDDSSYLSPGMTGVTSTHRSLSRICHITPFPAGETGKRKRAHDTFGEHQQSTTPHHRGRCQRLQLYLLVVCKLLFKNRILSSNKIQYINKANVELFWLK